MEEQTRYALTQILEEHARQINLIGHHWSTVSSGTTVAADILFVDSTGTAAVTVTLVKAEDWRDRPITIKKVSTGGKAIVTAQSGEQINESNTYCVTGSYASVQLVSDGSNWWSV